MDEIVEVPYRSDVPVLHIDQVEGHEVGVLVVYAAPADGGNPIHGEGLDIAFFGGYKGVAGPAEGTRSPFDLIGGVLVGDPGEYARPSFRGLHGVFHPRGKFLQKNGVGVAKRSNNEKDLAAAGPRRFLAGI